MYDNPSTLETLCLDCICDNLRDIFDSTYDKGFTDSSSSSSDDSIKSKSDRTKNRRTKEKEKLTFKDSDLFLFNELSEKLLLKLCDKQLICDTTLSLFNERNTRLRIFKLKNVHDVTQDGLRILKQHKIVDLEIVNLKSVCISKILECISDWSLKHLTSLNLSKCSFIDITRYSLTVYITNLKNLKSLNVSYTEFNQFSLELVCEDLKLLEKLDISGTVVHNLTPLLSIADHLISLTVSDLKLINTMADVILKLKNLRHLDISLFNERYGGPRNDALMTILQSAESLPDLTYFDISGWRNVNIKAPLTIYLTHHSHIQYLGLVLNPVNFDLTFSESTHNRFRKDLIIGGLGNEEQIKITLKKYWERPSYVQKALYHLFQLTMTFTTARPDVFELVLQPMAAHPSNFGVQMAATACLYNVTRGELSKNIHPHVLSKGVSLTLNAMECFPEEYQLQKNSLLILCSDRILQEVNFERYRCAKLVLDSLCLFEDINMNRMAVAICSILAAKVTTSETSILGAKPFYMRKLLSMVQSRVETKSSDITMKFTLSALWNLTDESAATCKVFLEQSGALLFLKVLTTFRNDSAIETKVLGLLNNIAEVESLRHNLMIDSLISELYLLLKSEHIDVSYFAAGIVAHLASDGPSNWTVFAYTRSYMLKALESAVSQWNVPESEMVAYRSFKPFFPLLRPNMDYQVQLWAVWAIHHVCTKNPKRYCLMLEREDGTQRLNDLLVHETTHSYIKQISRQILAAVDTNVTL